MTQFSTPWDGTGLGDGGPYSADQWATIWAELIGAGAGAGGSANSGILWGSGANPDPGLTVAQNSPTGQSIILTPGKALVDGTYYENTSDLVIATAANGSGNPRVDTVVLQKTWGSKTVRAAVKQGTPAGSPTPPGMTQTPGVVWEAPIADLTLANGYTNITNALITNRLNYKNVAVMDVIENVQNASGATVIPGDVGVWGNAAVRQVTTSLLRGAAVAGVWMDRVVNGGYGRILRRGIYPVKLAVASAVLNSLVVHEAVFSGTIPTATHSKWNAFASTLEITAGAGLCLCYVDVSTPRPKANDGTLYNTPADITLTVPSGSFAAIDANLAVTFTTNTGRVKVTFTFPAYMNVSSAGTVWLYFNQLLDGVTPASAGANGINICPVSASVGTLAQSVTVEYIWEGLTPGTHTVAATWRIVLGTGTGPTAGVRQYNAQAGFAAFSSYEELDA